MKKSLIALLFLLYYAPSFALLNTPFLTSPTNGSLNNSPNEILDWSSVTSATGYEYKLSTDPGLAGATIITVTGSSQANTSNLFFGTVYYWQVRAIKTSAPVDSSAWSTIWIFTTVDQLFLTSPVNGSLFNSPNETLDWSGMTGITNYDYELDTVSTFNSPLLLYASTGTTSQVSTANLRFGTTYYWRVRARHTVDTTQWSTIWNFTTVDQLFLTSPVNGSLFNSPNETLDWSGMTGITNYDYELDTVSTFNSPLLLYASTGTTSQVSSANLRFGTTYYWRVRARHIVDTTQWSTIWNFTTVDQLSLTSPVIGSLFNSPNETLDWSGMTGITNYDYELDTVSTFNSPLLLYASTGTTSQISTANLRFGTTYYWRVRARHLVDTTQWSTIWNFTTLDQLSLTSPVNGSLFNSPNETLDWSGMTGITNYDYELDTVSTFNSPLLLYASNGTTSQVSTANLRFGTTYYWRVRARHTVDTTQWSTIWDFTTIEYLSHVSPANNSIGISLNPLIDWTAISGINGYQYRYSTDINFSNPSLFTIGTTSQANLTSLSYGTQYFWQVRAFHTADTSEWSLPWSFTTIYQITTAPSLISPADGTVNIPTTGTSLQWSSVSSATLYEYQLDDNASFTSPVINTTASLNDLTGSLTSGITYYWRVRAGNGSGYSPWSTTWSFTAIFQLTTAPTLISPADGAISIPVTGTSLEWSSVNLATLYEYELDDNVAFSSPAVNTTASLNDLTGSLISGSTYYWRVRAGNGSGFSPWSVVWSFTTESVSGISTQIKNEKFSVYPNPSSGIININANYNVNAIAIYNNLGEKVFQSEIKNPKFEIDLTSHPKGIYFIEIKNSVNIYHKKIVVR